MRGLGVQVRVISNKRKVLFVFCLVFFRLCSRRQEAFRGQAQGD